MKRHGYSYWPIAMLVLLAVLLLACHKERGLAPATNFGISLTGVQPAQGAADSIVTVQGGGFSPAAAQDSVRFGHLLATIIAASPGGLQVRVPVGLPAGPVAVSVSVNNQRVQLAGAFRVTAASPAPLLLSATPTSGAAGMLITLQGAHLGRVTANDTLRLGSFSVPLRSVEDSVATFTVPPGLPLGTVPISLTLGSQQAKLSMPFTINAAQPIIDSISPTTGPGGTLVIIYGSQFSNQQALNAVKINGMPAVVSSTSTTQIIASVPLGAGAGPVSVTVDGLTATTVQPFNYIKSYQISSLAGGGPAGYKDSSGAGAQFNDPLGIARDALGNLYVSDAGNERLRKVVADSVVSTFSGNGMAALANGPAATASFYGPSGLVLDGLGNLYVADYGNHCIRKVAPDGSVTTFAGTGQPGFVNGPGNQAQFAHPTALCLDGAGVLYVADEDNHAVRKIATDGTVTTLAGSGQPGWVDSTGLYAQFNEPKGLAVDGAGNVYVADYQNHLLRKISPAGRVTTLAGNGIPGLVDAQGSNAQFRLPAGIALDGLGNLYVADEGNNALRLVTPAGAVSTPVGGNGNGFVQGNAKYAKLYQPTALVVDATGAIYLVDTGNNAIRKVVFE